jgi:dihydroorotase
MLILRNGRVLDPSRGLDEFADVVVEDGRVTRVGRGAADGVHGERVRVHDVAGCWIVPGLVDLHVHFREPGQEYKEDIATGLRAAAAGGFTQVCAMPNTKPVNDTRAITEAMLARARSVSTAERAATRLQVFGAITKGLEGKELAEMADLQAAGAIGVSDDGHCVMNAAVMRRALEYARTFDLLVSQHCEDHDLTAGALMHEGAVSTKLGLRGWPRVAEDVIVARDLLLAELTGARYHVAHLSSKVSVRLLREAKSRGLRVSAEVTPHHLTMTHESVLGYDTACKVNPPLREAEDVAALQEALRDGTIDCIATDHAPHSTIEKDCEFSAALNGMIGIDTVVPAMLELVRRGIVTPLRLIEALSTAPAKVAKLEGGSLAIGARADVTVIDPDARWTVTKETLRSKSHNTPLLGREVQGRVRLTLVGGAIAHELA